MALLGSFVYYNNHLYYDDNEYHWGLFHQYPELMQVLENSVEAGGTVPPMVLGQVHHDINLEDPYTVDIVSDYLDEEFNNRYNEETDDWDDEDPQVDYKSSPDLNPSMLSDALYALANKFDHAISYGYHTYEPTQKTAKPGRNFCIYGDGKRAKNWVWLMVPDSDTGVPTPSLVGLCNNHVNQVEPYQQFELPSRQAFNMLHDHHICREEPCSVCESNRHPKWHAELSNSFPFDVKRHNSPDFPLGQEDGSDSNNPVLHDPSFPSWQEYDLRQDTVEQPQSPFYDAYGPNFSTSNVKTAAPAPANVIQLKGTDKEPWGTKWVLVNGEKLYYWHTGDDMYPVHMQKMKLIKGQNPMMNDPNVSGWPNYQAGAGSKIMTPEEIMEDPTYYYGQNR